VQDRGPSASSVTLERGVDGTYLAWVDELPGCAVRGSDRGAVLEEARREIPRFLRWAGLPEPADLEVDVSDEVESAIETDEDTEVLVAADRDPLTAANWASIRKMLQRSREELLALLRALGPDELETKREGSERTIREEIEHIALVELMYAAWTFDLRSPVGLAGLLAWAREASASRITALAEQEAGGQTWAEWASAPRPESWTPRKAARRLLWHELLDLRALERRRS
jgi:hypothetical protein